MAKYCQIARLDSTQPEGGQDHAGIYKKLASSPRAEIVSSYCFESYLWPVILFAPGLLQTLRKPS